MTIDQYINGIADPAQKAAFTALMNVLDEHLPAGFEKGMQFGFPSYYVPLSLYPKGYHVNPAEPLPFIAAGVQKNYISLYHMGIYANPALLHWFQSEYPKHVSTKLNMGKSCIRFSNPGKIPFTLVGQLASKMTPQDWIAIVERSA